MPTVADLQRIATELAAMEQAASANAAILQVLENADKGIVHNYAKWEGGRLAVWTAGALGNPETFSIAASVPPSVVELLQVAAATAVDRAAGLLDQAKQATTAQGMRKVAEVSARAKAYIEEASTLEGAAAECASGHAAVHLSSRRGYGRSAGVCIVTPSGQHICVQPTYDGYEYNHRWEPQVGGPCCTWSNACAATLLLHHPTCPFEGYQKQHTCWGVHPIVTELSAAYAAAIRMHHGLLVPMRPPLLIEERPLRTLRIATKEG